MSNPKCQLTEMQRLENQKVSIESRINYFCRTIFWSYFITGFLEQIKRETNQIITKIRSHTDNTENIRRIQEEKLRKERANKIQTEVITSHKKNVEIDWTWQELEEKEDCEELAKVSFTFNLFHSFC